MNRPQNRENILTVSASASLTGHNAAADGKSGTWVSEDAGNANPGEEAAKGTYAFSIIGGTDDVYGAFTVE